MEAAFEHRATPSPNITGFYAGVQGGRTGTGGGRYLTVALTLTQSSPSTENVAWLTQVTFEVQEIQLFQFSVWTALGAASSWWHEQLDPRPLWMLWFSEQRQQGVG